ncbi:MAG: putative sugar O-methyltransferase [Pirellulales bacterium]
MDDQTRSGRWANWGRALRALLLGPRRDVLAHPVDGRWPRVPLEIVPDIAPTPTDVAHAERLLAAFSRCRASGATERREGQSDLWTEIRQRQATFFGVLDAGDPAALAAYLCNMNRHDATTGTVQGDGEYRRLRRSPRYRRFLAHMAKDKLVSLAEAVGAIPCENPEQGTWGQNIHRDHDQLVGAIEATLGLEITPPPIDGGLLKMRTSRGLFNERDLNALYTAWSVRQLFPDELPAVAEIGGGAGRVAYWSCRLGIREYTIVDLPHINVIQGFYLLKALPEAQVVLYGEPRGTTTGPRIVILPAHAREEVADQSVDVVLNQDSFPEIHRQIVLDYLAWIQRVSRRYFYSINHESRPPSTVGGTQLNVPELIGTVTGYRRLSRTPYWLRRGYVAELYRLQRS